MRKIFTIIAITGMLILSLCGCKASDTTPAVQTENQPDIMQVRSICELATLECYYHNVAKLEKEKGSGLLHLGEKKRVLWIEYTGVADIGIDMSKVRMKADGTEITITLPAAKLISYKVKSIDQDDFILSDDAKLNKNPVTADEQTKAVDAAQEKMKKSVESNSALLMQAQERAKTLIENYITKIGEAAKTEYHITWEYEEEAVDTAEADTE